MYTPKETPRGTFRRFLTGGWGIHVEPCPPDLSAGAVILVYRKKAEPLEKRLGRRLWQTSSNSAMFALDESEVRPEGLPAPQRIRRIWDEIDAKYGRGRKALDNAV